jgi:hypothetical protein
MRNKSLGFFTFYYDAIFCITCSFSIMPLSLSNSVSLSVTLLIFLINYIDQTIKSEVGKLFLITDFISRKGFHCQISITIGTLFYELRLYSDSSQCYVLTVLPFLLFFSFSGVRLTSPGTAATSGLLYSPR